jgi:hypothetical protein
LRPAETKKNKNPCQTQKKRMNRLLRGNHDPFPPADLSREDVENLLFVGFAFIIALNAIVDQRQSRLKCWLLIVLGGLMVFRWY